MRALVFILIPVLIILSACNHHHSGQVIDRPDVGIDPWGPVSDDVPSNQDSNWPGNSLHGDETPIPEPSSMVLLGGGILFALWRRKKNDNKER